jgi:glycosyltransferase involved in cell wall biosynthesis
LRNNEKTESLRAQDPLVSVVIPACNASRTLPDTLISARVQSFPALEIIVVDDGSADDTAEIVAAAARDDCRVSLHRQDRSGVAAARNRGVACARGRWIAPMDADDQWAPEKIEKQVAQFEAGRRELGLVYTWTRVVDEEGRLLRDLQVSRRGDVFVPLLLHNIVGHGSGPLLARNCLEKVGLYDTGFFNAGAQGCEDWDLYLRIARSHHFELVPEPLVRYRKARRAMSAHHETMERSYRRMWAKLVRDVPGISKTLVRWAHSVFYDALAVQAREDGTYRYGFRCAVRSWLLNPVRFRELRTYRLAWGLLRRCPPRASAGSVATPVCTGGTGTADRPSLYLRREAEILAQAEAWWAAQRGRFAESSAVLTR